MAWPIQNAVIGASGSICLLCLHRAFLELKVTLFRVGGCLAGMWP